MSESNASINSCQQLSLVQKETIVRVAIVGGGIAGACVASVLASVHPSFTHALEPQASKKSKDWFATNNVRVEVHLFDQGRSGVGGRSSHRVAKDEEDRLIGHWDHGCQFFRADVPLFQSVVKSWMKHQFVAIWRGRFASSSSTYETAERGFFGFPSQPPFYVGSGPNGMKSVAKGILDTVQSQPSLQVFSQTRVEKIQFDKSKGQWTLFGTSGKRAFHDTAESHVTKEKERNGLEQLPFSNESTKEVLYDAVVLTDVSCCFENWHRASAGVPLDFCQKVQERLGARVPLFTVLLVLESTNEKMKENRKNIIPLDGISFPDHEILWFASKTNSKPVIQPHHETGAISAYRECWTLVSTPEYALKKIAETPMQTQSGEFIPQTPQYLHSIPIPDLEKAFRSQIESPKEILGDLALDPKDYKVVYRDAQRWGSALPSHDAHSDDISSSTRQIIMGVPYEVKRKSLAPTQLEKSNRVVKESSFVADEEQNLFQCGDMMSKYTPGYEGAALSGMEAAENVLNCLINTVV